MALPFTKKSVEVISSYHNLVSLCSMTLMPPNSNEEEDPHGLKLKVFSHVFPIDIARYQGMISLHIHTIVPWPFEHMFVK